jgi:hypothetical protein
MDLGPAWRRSFFPLNGSTLLYGGFSVIRLQSPPRAIRSGHARVSVPWWHLHLGLGGKLESAKDRFTACSK